MIENLTTLTDEELKRLIEQNEEAGKDLRLQVKVLIDGHVAGQLSPNDYATELSVRAENTKVWAQRCTALRNEHWRRFKK